MTRIFFTFPEERQKVQSPYGEIRGLQYTAGSSISVYKSQDDFSFTKPLREALGGFLLLSLSTAGEKRLLKKSGESSLSCLIKKKKSFF